MHCKIGMILIYKFMTKIKQSIILIKSGSYFEFVFRNSFRNAEPILCAEAGFGLEQKEES